MSDRDALMLTLIRGLEGAATATDVVDDATRQQIGGLLSPKARRLLAALTAPAPATPTAEAAANDAPAAASEEAPEPPAKKPAVFGVPAAAFVVTSFDDLPEDALGAIASFSDIKTLTCIATCRALRDACAKLSPRLEHALVLKKFPLLGTVVKSPEGAPVPGELFSTYTRFFEGPRRRPTKPQPTAALDAYTLSLEIELYRTVNERHSPWADVPASAIAERQSVYSGTGVLREQECYEFPIPAGVFERVDDLTSRSWRLRAKVMASRRVGGRLQFAKLFQGGVMDWIDDGTVIFDWEEIPPNPENGGVLWQYRNMADYDLYVDPQLNLVWAQESGVFANRQSKVEARFKLMTEGDTFDMTLSDACLCLEHYVGWSE